MRKICVGLVLLTWLCSSCEKKNETRYNGEFQLSSEKLQAEVSYNHYGFTFEDGAVKVYQPNSKIPDLEVIYNDFNHITTLQSSSNPVDPFYKNGDFASTGEAEAFFNGYREVTATIFQVQADTIAVNQVWTFRTAADKFAKIWIKDIQYMSGVLGDFVELTIRYQYQPDGTRIFPE
jgi:hypothetical protein